jgi:Flp pilus assembly pilin Flp
MSLRKLFQRLHRDERGVVSLETVLIIAAIALPVLIIIIKFGWPRIKAYFDEGLDELERETDDAVHGN